MRKYILILSSILSVAASAEKTASQEWVLRQNYVTKAVTNGLVTARDVASIVEKNVIHMTWNGSSEPTLYENARAITQAITNGLPTFVYVNNVYWLRMDNWIHQVTPYEGVNYDMYTGSFCGLSSGAYNAIYASITAVPELFSGYKSATAYQYQYVSPTVLSAATGNVYTAAKEYTDSMVGKTPDYANVSNKAVNSIQKSGINSVSDDWQIPNLIYLSDDGLKTRYFKGDIFKLGSHIDSEGMMESSLTGLEFYHPEGKFWFGKVGSGNFSILTADSSPVATSNMADRIVNSKTDLLRKVGYQSKWGRETGVFLGYSKLFIGDKADYPLGSSSIESEQAGTSINFNSYYDEYFDGHFTFTSHNTDFSDYRISYLCPDGSPVATSNMVNRISDSKLEKLSDVKVGKGSTLVVTNPVTGVIKEVQDYKIILGDAKALATDTQDIAIGRDAETYGAASMAIGPNAEADKDFGLAIGWRSISAGAGGISIGMGYRSSTNFWLDAAKTIRNPVADYTAAVSEKSIAIGRSAYTEAPKAIAIGDRARVNSGADGAVQLGYGTNSVANTLKFQNVTIVENGKVVGTGYAKPVKADPVEISPEEFTLNVEPGLKYTLLPTNPMRPGTEMNIPAANNERNYEIFFANETNLCVGLPIEFDFSQIPGSVKIINKITQPIIKLPIKFISEQPYEKVIITKVEELDDGTDWTPVISELNITWDFDEGKFKTTSAASLRGTNLQAGVSYKIAYPINSSNATVTNDLMTISAGRPFLDQTFYGEVGPVTYTPATGQGPYFKDDESWFEIIYETKLGKAATVRKPIVVQ